jgi:hypothetical protein
MTRYPSVRAFPDLTGFAPASERWHAYDTDTYDGAPDAGCQIVGIGASEAAAIADYYAQAESCRLQQARLRERYLVHGLVEGIRSEGWTKGRPWQAEAADASMRLMIRAHRQQHTLLIRLENRI